MIPTHPMAGDSVQEQTHRSRVWTIPNLLSMARLAGVPVFLWLVLGPEADALALVLLMVSGITASRTMLSRLGIVHTPERWVCSCTESPAIG